MTACDAACSFAVARLIPALSAAAAAAFPRESLAPLDRRAELRIRHTRTKPRHAWTNGKVERSHRVDSEEFWSRHAFSDFDAAAAALPHWEHTYNHDRFSLALGGRTPAEKLATVLAAAPAAGARPEASRPRQSQTSQLVPFLTR